MRSGGSIGWRQSDATAACSLAPTDLSTYAHCARTGPRDVFDPSVLIAYIDANDDLHDAAETLLAAAIDDDLGANSLTLAEVLVAPARTGQVEAVHSALREIEMDELRFPSDTAVRLARLRASTSLKMPDCCVLLAAEDQHATIASFDNRLVQAAEDRNLAVLRR